MWDRLLVDCRIATIEDAPGNPLGLIDNGAIGIADGKIVRVGKRTELAGFRAKEVVALGGAWVTPGLIDCHTHLVFGGTRADEHAMRRAGATYEEIAEAGGGIASTVQATAAASDEELLEQSRRRLHALMRGGCTTVEIKSGYGLDPKSEMRLLKLAGELGEGEAVRIVPTLLALHALPADQRDRRAHYVGEIVDKLIPAAAKQGSRPASTLFARRSPSRPTRSSACSRRRAHHGLRVRLHAEQLSNQNGAALAAQYHALSADHLEHLDEAGAKAMAAAGTVAVLLPGAFYALQEKRKPPVAAAAQAQGADRHRHRLQPRHLAVAVADAGDEHGVHLVRPDARRGAGRNDHQRRARARPGAQRSAASPPARPRTCASGGSRRSPSSAIGSACPDPSGASSRGTMRNAAAALVALICWAGLAIQFSATFANQHHVVRGTLDAGCASSPSSPISLSRSTMTLER